MRRMVDIACGACGTTMEDAYLDWNEPYPFCTCGTRMGRKFTACAGASPTVIQDSIEGGIDIRHGICNDDGTPKRYYSRTEIRNAARAKGLTWGHDDNYHVPDRGSDRNKHTGGRWV